MKVTELSFNELGERVSQMLSDGAIQYNTGNAIVTTLGNTALIDTADSTAIMIES